MLKRRPTALLLRSPENQVHLEDMKRYYPKVDWIDAPMPPLPGHGEKKDERDQLLVSLATAKNQYPITDFVIYSRAYGAFSEEGRAAIESIFSVPVITAPGAVLEQLHTLGASKLYVITPYGQAHHDHELRWLYEQGFEVIASSCLGHDTGGEIQNLLAADIVAALRPTFSLKSGLDAVYIACTVVRTPAMAEDLQDAATVPIVSATQAMLWKLEKLVG
ncbi:aspartate/glutamate racemase family protein [Moorella naiadis]|uniref:aspartate racemase/maleate isomerase family protein n=1 Tax=Moorella naiadis (nom. illeg.) TaxID=3093670 RepID=UPI003D9C8C0E